MRRVSQSNWGQYNSDKIFKVRKNVLAGASLYQKILGPPVMSISLFHIVQLEVESTAHL